MPAAVHQLGNYVLGADWTTTTATASGPTSISGSGDKARAGAMGLDVTMVLSAPS
jgi:hypothetical protein